MTVKTVLAGLIPQLSIAESKMMDRICEEEYGIPVTQLMENAGLGLAQSIAYFFESRGETIAGQDIILCAGKGHNAGDGLIAVQHCHEWGATIHLIQMETDVIPAIAPYLKQVNALAESRILINEDLSINKSTRKVESNNEILDCEIRNAIQGKALILDGLCGVGLRGAPRPRYEAVIKAINQRESGHCLSIDCPSGLDCDSGQSEGAVVRADLTVSFAASKRGFHAESRQVTGPCLVVDIGVPDAVYAQLNHSKPGFDSEHTILSPLTE